MGQPNKTVQKMKDETEDGGKQKTAQGSQTIIADTEIVAGGLSFLILIYEFYSCGEYE